MPILLTPSGCQSLDRLIAITQLHRDVTDSRAPNVNAPPFANSLEVIKAMAALQKAVYQQVKGRRPRLCYKPTGVVSEYGLIVAQRVEPSSEIAVVEPML